MIHSVRGKILEISPVHVVIDCGGIGYHLQISLATYTALGNKTEVSVYCHLNINGNDFSLQLFGFATEDERDVFIKLISVSGVGPNTARMVLSGLSAAEVRQMIVAKDVDAFRRIKGIGQKTAERIIVDLHDKFTKGGDIITEKIGVQGNNKRHEALAALTLLGLEKTKSEKILDKLLITNAEIGLEELIKLALKQL
jgi:Holliday junction DNA helicase RuvA